MKKTKIKGKSKEKIDWHRVITLSAAGQYIQDQLHGELRKLEEITFTPPKKHEKK